MAVHLHIRSADGAVRTVPITEHDTFLLGRMPDCHLCVPSDPQVSRHHFLLDEGVHEQPGILYLESVSSKREENAGTTVPSRIKTSSISIFRRPAISPSVPITRSGAIS